MHIHRDTNIYKIYNEIILCRILASLNSSTLKHHTEWNPKSYSGELVFSFKQILEMRLHLAVDGRVVMYSNNPCGQTTGSFADVLHCLWLQWTKTWKLNVCTSSYWEQSLTYSDYWRNLSKYLTYLEIWIMNKFFQSFKYVIRNVVLVIEDEILLEIFSDQENFWIFPSAM